MSRKLYFIRHIPTGQWYESSRKYTKEFDAAAVFHQQANAEKQIRQEALIIRGKFSPENWPQGASLQVDVPERMVEYPGIEGLHSNRGRDTVLITEHTLNDLQVVTFVLVEYQNSNVEVIPAAQAVLSIETNRK